MYTDSHAHLTSEMVIDQLEPLLKRAEQSNVSKIINICTDKPSLEKGLLLAERFDWIYNTAATTPHDVVVDGEHFFPLVEKAAADHRLVAIGETGLDYYYEHADRAVQKQFLIRYFHLALQNRLPIVIHCRDAFDDLFSIADKEYRDAPAVIHCFTGTLEEAREVMERGWYVSCSGIVTFKNSNALREVIKYLPLDRLFIETDTPYLAPQSQRGKTNEPSYIRETAETIARLKDIPVEEVARQTTKNACKFFYLKT